MELWSEDVKIVNEIVALMGNTLLRKLFANICEACWFSIIADETRDTSNHKQLAITIWWVNNIYEVQENLIGMVHVPSTTSSTLTAAIKDVLVHCRGYNSGMSLGTIPALIPPL